MNKGVVETIILYMNLLVDVVETQTSSFFYESPITSSPSTSLLFHRLPY